MSKKRVLNSLKITGLLFIVGFLFLFVFNKSSPDDVITAIWGLEVETYITAVALSVMISVLLALLVKRMQYFFIGELTYALMLWFCLVGSLSAGIAVGKILDPAPVVAFFSVLLVGMLSFLGYYLFVVLKIIGWEDWQLF